VVLVIGLRSMRVENDGRPRPQSKGARCRFYRAIQHWSKWPASHGVPCSPYGTIASYPAPKSTSPCAISEPESEPESESSIFSATSKNGNHSAKREFLSGTASMSSCVQLQRNLEYFALIRVDLKTTTCGIVTPFFRTFIEVHI